MFPFHQFNCTYFTTVGAENLSQNDEKRPLRPSVDRKMALLSLFDGEWFARPPSTFFPDALHPASVPERCELGHDG